MPGQPVYQVPAPSTLGTQTWTVFESHYRLLLQQPSEDPLQGGVREPYKLYLLLFVAFHMNSLCVCVRRGMYTQWSITRKRAPNKNRAEKPKRQVGTAPNTVNTNNTTGFPLFWTDKIPWYFHDFSRFLSKFPGIFSIIFKVWVPSGFEYKYANLLSFIWTKN